jgi:hypothetical protein
VFDFFLEFKSGWQHRNMLLDRELSMMTSIKIYGLIFIGIHKDSVYACLYCRGKKRTEKFVVM